MRLLKEIRSVLGNYHLKSGIYHFYRGEYKQAIEFLARARSSADPLTESDAGMAHYYLTEAHLSAAEEAHAEGDMARQITELRAAVAIDPSFPDILFRLARALERAGAGLERVLRIGPPLRAPEVRQEHHPGALLAEELEDVALALRQHWSGPNRNPGERQAKIDRPPARRFFRGTFRS